jgi:hypothetical protein
MSRPNKISTGEWLLIGTLLLGLGLAIWKRKAIAHQIEKAVDIILSKEQELIVSELHPLAQPIMRAFIKDVTDRGYKVILTSGYRSLSEQLKQWIAGLSKSDQEKYENGTEASKLKSKNARPGLSGHNYGMAIDLNLYKDGETYKKKDSDAKWNSTGIPQLAKEKYGMTWGGDLSSYQDPVHFDLSKKFGGTEKLRELAIAQYGSIDKAEGNKVKIAA